MTERPRRNVRVVAELGRPETPAETAARKAEASRKHRSNQTLRNLILALLASLGVVLFLVLVVVRPGQLIDSNVDYAKIASDAQGTVSETLASPDLPASWSANAAELSTGSDDVQSWYIGLITPSTQFIGLRQGIDANASWVSDRLEKARKSGETSIGGIRWTVYDQRATVTAPSNFEYSLSATVGKSTYLLYGTASTKDFTTVATALATQLRETR
jgi:hypothetical protein